MLMCVVWTASPMMDGIARSSAKSRFVILFIIIMDYVLRISMDKNNTYAQTKEKHKTSS